MKSISIISPHYRGPRYRLENIALSLKENFIVNLFIFSSEVPKNIICTKGKATFYYIKIPLIIRRLRLYYLFHIPIIILSALKGDILLTNEVYKTASIAGLISKIMGKKMILFYGTLYFEELKLHTQKVSSIPKRFKVKLYNLLEFISISTVECIISPDRRITKYFQEHRLNPKIINWFNIGTVNIHKFSFDQRMKRKYRRKMNIQDKDIILLFVGAINKTDGVDIAIKVFETISKRRTDIGLVLIGTGQPKFIGELKKHISNNKMKNIIFTGHVPYSLIHNYMMISDIALLPMREPNCGIGNIVVELMSIGIPVICSNYSEIKRIIINGQYGFISEDENEFIATTLNLINDKSKRHEISSNQRDYAINNFSYHAFSEKFEMIIESLFQARAQAKRVKNFCSF